jgi:hypothetical protein
MTLYADSLYAGEEATFTVEDASPEKNVYFIYSLSGPGSTYVPQLDVTLGLDDPVLAGSARADDQGTAVFTKMIPSVGQGREVWLQAAERGNITQVIHAQIE